MRWTEKETERVLAISKTAQDQALLIQIYSIRGSPITENITKYNEMRDSDIWLYQIISPIRKDSAVAWHALLLQQKLSFHLKVTSYYSLLSGRLLIKTVSFTSYVHIKGFHDFHQHHSSKLISPFPLTCSPTVFNMSNLENGIRLHSIAVNRCFPLMVSEVQS